MKKVILLVLLALSTTFVRSARADRDRYDDYDHGGHCDFAYYDERRDQVFVGHGFHRGHPHRGYHYHGLTARERAFMAEKYRSRAEKEKKEKEEERKKKKKKKKD